MTAVVAVVAIAVAVEASSRDVTRIAHSCNWHLVRKDSLLVCLLRDHCDYRVSLGTS